MRVPYILYFCDWWICKSFVRVRPTGSELLIYCYDRRRQWGAARTSINDRFDRIHPSSVYLGRGRDGALSSLYPRICNVNWYYQVLTRTIESDFNGKVVVAGFLKLATHSSFFASEEDLGLHNIKKYALCVDRHALCRQWRAA